MVGVLALFLVPAIAMSSIHQYANASKHHHGQTPDNTGGSTSDANVITSQTPLSEIPGEVPGDRAVSVGTMLS